MGERLDGSAALTAPNLISALRIASIPVFVALIVHRPTTFVGLLVFTAVLATDWLDGVLARGLGQVSELGKILDPLADRLCLVAGIVALTVRDAFPLAAALPVLLRDAAFVLVGGVAFAARGIRIEVRRVGKVATFALMVGIACIAWGRLGYPLEAAFLAIGWASYAVGLVAYALASASYVGDLRRALSPSL
jgi:cardiolipin synthase